jgi:hypothetical protein
VSGVTLRPYRKLRMDPKSLQLLCSKNLIMTAAKVNGY